MLGGQVLTCRRIQEPLPVRRGGSAPSAYSLWMQQGRLARRPWVAGVLLGLAMAAVGCDRRLAAYVPPEQEPPPPARPVRVPGLDLPEHEPTLLEAGRGAERAAAAAPEPDAPLLGGTVDLGPGVEPPARSVLFVIARSAAAGPPLAVKRLPAGRFPIPFALGAQDVMIPGRRLEGAITLTARVDSDGNPLTRDARDLEGGLPGQVQVPALDLKIVLRGGS
jgi:hypothetical protein